jgi:hypothetical protein
MNIKITQLILFASLWSVVAFGQAKKPTLMILPSDNWCVQRYFITEFDNQGLKQKVPNYKQAFQEDTEIGQVISKIGSLMIDRGFPLKDAEQEIKNIEARSAEDNMTSSTTSSAGLAETPLDKLKNKAKADIILQIWWKVTKSENGRVVSFILEALDAYTSKRVASSSGNSLPNQTEILPVLLQQAIVSNIDPFVSQLQAHFDDMQQNGREIKLTVRRWNSWTNNLETEINGNEIRNHIYDWIQKNSVKGRFNEANSSEDRIDYDQLRIPLYDDRNRSIDARQYAINLQKFLKSPPFNFEVKLMTRGLGEAILVLGEK